MGSKANAKANQEWAHRMREAGIYHGKRLSKGLDNIPSLKDVGSAAYRRRNKKN